MDTPHHTARHHTVDRRYARNSCRARTHAKCRHGHTPRATYHRLEVCSSRKIVERARTYAKCRHGQTPQARSYHRLKACSNRTSVERVHTQNCDTNTHHTHARYDRLEVCSNRTFCLVYTNTKSATRNTHHTRGVTSLKMEGLFESYVLLSSVHVHKKVRHETHDHARCACCHTID